MYIKIFKLIALLFVSFSAFAQSLNSKELHYLQSTIGIYLINHEKMDGHKRPSEFIICLLSIDTAGKVNNIILLADDKNKDSTYFYLSLMKPDAFKDWRGINCKGKTIMMPVVSTGQGYSPEYINDLIKLYPVKKIVVENETNTVVIISALQYNAPVEKKSF
jgi:hypothetical protein